MTLSTLLDVVLAIGTLVALGYGVLTLIAPRAPLWWFERAAFSFVLGVGAGSLVWVVLTPVYGVLQPAAALMTTTSIVLVMAFGRRRAGTKADGESRTRSLRADVLLIGCAIVVVLSCAALLAASLRTTLGWDGLFNMELKARLAFEHRPQGQLPLAYLGDVSRVWSHPRYPLLVPSAEFWIYSWLGHVDQRAIKVLFPLSFFALVAGLSGAIRRVTNAETALASCAAVACAMPMLTILGNSGYAEIPLSAAVTAALSCSMIAVNTGEPALFLLAGVFAAIAAWTKAEGLLLAECLGAAVFMADRWRGRRRESSTLPRHVAGAVLWMPLVAVAPWFMLQHFYGMTEPDFPSFLPSVAVDHLNRLPEIVMLVTRALLTPGSWGLLWPAFAVACVMAVWRRDADPPALLCAGVVLVPLVAYTLIYLFSAWSDVGEHVRTSIDRLLTPLASAALIFTVSRVWLSFT